MECILFAYLLLAGLGDFPPDLLTLIDADMFFQSRQIPAEEDQLRKLAASQPVNAKGQVAQLLAIRWLGTHQVQSTHETLAGIARRNATSDPFGFAREYAERALASLEGKAPKTPTSSAGGLRNGLQWFPADGNFFGAIDLCDFLGEPTTSFGGFWHPQAQRTGKLRRSGRAMQAR